MHIDTAQVRAVANDLEDSLSAASADALDAVTRSVDDSRAALATRSADLREVVGDRAGEWRDVVRSRARELEQDLPVDADDAWAYAQMGGWHLVRGLIALVAFIPRLVVRALGGLSDVVDELAGRGVDMRGRGRDLAAAIPGAGRRQSTRRRAVRLVAFGAVIGFVGGVAASRRRAPIVTYDVPPRAPLQDAGSIDAAPLSDVARPSDAEAPVGGPEAPVGGPEAPVGGPEAPVGGPEAPVGDDASN